ncbi:MAG: polysaccharide deacetylase family protein [Chloracidobacterium sp.]|nr:polysaccharide deacetylase family protein [Chloracidobacterium sp.]
MTIETNPDDTCSPSWSRTISTLERLRTLIQQRNWSIFEPRYEQNTLKTLDLLDRYDTRATFFVLGWIAEHNPALVRDRDRGHEVASRGYYHRSPRNLTPNEFREDLRRTERGHRGRNRPESDRLPRR